LTHWFERRWVSLVDSDRVRRYLRSNMGRRISASQGYQATLDAGKYLTSALAAVRRPGRFESVGVCFAFVGHTKSGGSLLGALLDAHPRVACADELGIFRLLDRGFTRSQILHLIVRGSRREALKGRVTGRRIGSYSLAVDGMHQGEAGDDLRALGDSRAGPTTRLLDMDLALVDRMVQHLGDIDLRFIHVVRNPYDPIAVMVLRGGRTIDDALGDYLGQCHRLVRLRQAIEPEKLATVRYEDLVSRPEIELERVCAFLEVDVTDDYLQACAAVIEQSPRRDRDRIDWPDASRAAVEDLIHGFEFLTGYGFEELT
jgi:hypothetical protein